MSALTDAHVKQIVDKLNDVIDHQARVIELFKAIRTNLESINARVTKLENDARIIPINIFKDH